jgi:hypothetical protein
MLKESYEKIIYDSGIKKIVYSIGKEVSEDTVSRSVRDDGGLGSHLVIRCNYLPNDVLEIININQTLVKTVEESTFDKKE